MGTSGNFSTSNTFVKYTISVTTNSQSIEDNRSNVTVKVRFFRTNSGYSTYGSGTVYCKINGTTYSASVTSSQKITNSGIDLFEKTLDIGHNNDGSKYLDTSAWISLNTPLTSSEQWYGEWLKAIPRAATFQNADNFNDEQNPKIYFKNPGGFKLVLKMEAGGNSQLIVRDNLQNPASPYTFYLTDSERNQLRDLCPNSKTLAVRFTVATYMPNASTPSDWSYGDRTMTIVNATPIFSDSQLTYCDTNSETVGVTGNNQLIVQNKSNLEVTFTAATAQKSAQIKRYRIRISNKSVAQTAAGTYSLGVLNTVENQTLSVRAYDSRNNAKTISKTVSVVSWSPPVFIKLEAPRQNNYENTVSLFANVEISSVNGKNALQTLQYRLKKSGESNWGEWKSFENHTSTAFDVDNNFSWDLNVQARDKFGETSQVIVIPKGLPLVFLDTKKFSVGMNCFPANEKSIEVNGNIFAKGNLYSADSGGIYLNQYGNIHSQSNMTTGSWGVYNNDKTCFKVNWGDKRITGGIGNIYQAKTLYENGNGTSGTVTLADYAYNYNVMDVMYRTNDWLVDTTRVLSPDGKNVILHGAYFSESMAYAKMARVRINNNTITFSFNGECNLTEDTVTTASVISIIHVIGYT